MLTFWRKPPLLVVGCILGGFLAASCSSVPAPSSSSPSSGATVTFALPPGAVANYVSPFVSGPESNNQDLFQFEALMYRPLYWFGKNGSPTINYRQSLANPPAFSNGGRTVTITLKHWLWSDGKPVTSRDVEFWINLLKAEKGNYVGYVPGGIPDNLVAMSFPRGAPYSFSLTFNKSYSSLYLLYNNLSCLFAIPQHAWDKTSSGSPVGNFDESVSGAKEVWAFLNKQSQNESTFSSNPLWKIVDGPWKLTAFTPSTGFAAFVPNGSYSGPDKPKIARFEEIPFTSDTAEFDALRAGSLDYGYLPAEDLSQSSYFTSHGYSVVKWPAFGFNDFFLNFNYPGAGAIFSQLYVRQAMQSLINQSALVQAIWHGSAYPTYGPVPLTPRTEYTSAANLANPYPYSPAHAESLLQSHGWSINPGGTDQCVRPGTAPGECGAGIAAGASMNFTELLASGSAPFTAQAEAIKSAWASVGIQVTLHLEALGEVFSAVSPCAPNSASCGWEIANFGEPGATPTYSPQYLPAGAPWFETGAVDNPQGFSSQLIDSLIRDTYTNSSPQLIGQISAAVGKALPALWQPNYYYQVSVISNRLHGAVPQDPDLNIYPQKWTVS